jgi:transposase-like protein
MQFVHRCLECGAERNKATFKHFFGRFTSGFVLLANSATIWRFDSSCASCSREVEGVEVCSLSPVVLSTKPHNRQRQLTISINSSTASTASTTTVAKRFQCRQCTKSYTAKNSLQVHIEAVHFGIRHRCPNCKSTARSHRSTLGSSLASHVRPNAISMRSMSKALSEARLVDRAQGLAHRGRFGSLLQVVRFVSVSVLLLLQLLCVGGRCSHTFLPITSAIRAILNHNKTEESSNDDDDG